MNLDLYKKMSVPPAWAKKTITNGTLSGKTDISPMWRIEVMTQTFGPCGIGWKYEITNQWEKVCPDQSVMCFCNINLYIKQDGEWSEPIPGTGGSRLINRFGTKGGKEEGYLDPSDEGYKMALTDALSVSMKALGVGASVYSNASDPDKYNVYIEKKSKETQELESIAKTINSIMGDTDFIGFLIGESLDPNEPENHKIIYDNLGSLKKRFLTSQAQ